uniref:Fibronectin type-III domain-containing protein n=1 Tax=Ciona savignyi TaxID=51511 RepID=H2Z3W1_CIOSA
MDRIVCIVVCSLCIVSTVESQGLNRPLIPAPENVRVDQNSVSHTSVWLTWDLVAKADSYTVTLRPISLTASGIGSGIREKFTIIRGLLPNTDYEFTIRAVKGDNVGVPAVITQRTALPAARNLQINSTTVTATSMTVTWSAIQDVEYYKVAVDPPIGVIGTGSRTYTTSITLRGMSANTLYNIIIIPFNYVGDGARATVSHYTKMRPPTRLVVNLATVTSSTIGFQWQQVDGTHGYQLRVSPSVPGLDLNQLILETEFVLRRLSPDVLYLI